MRVIAIANDGVQKRAQDNHSAFSEEKRFDPEGDAVAKNADEDGNCDRKDHELVLGWDWRFPKRQSTRMAAPSAG